MALKLDQSVHERFQNQHASVSYVTKWNFFKIIMSSNHICKKATKKTTLFSNCKISFFFCFDLCLSLMGLFCPFMFSKC